jgi:hypothetical protein
MAFDLLNFIFNESKLENLEETIKRLETERDNLSDYIDTKLNQTLRKKYGDSKFEAIKGKYGNMIEIKKNELYNSYKKEIDKNIVDLRKLYSELLILS